MAIPTVTAGASAGENAVSTAARAKGSSGAERRKRNSARAIRVPATAATAGDHEPGVGPAAPPTAIDTVPSRATRASNQMLRVRRPGQMRARIPMRRSVGRRGRPADRPFGEPARQLSDDAVAPSVDVKSLLPADAGPGPVPADFSPTARTPSPEVSMITVSGLTKQYGTRTVVDDVSFALEPGTVTGFLGPNGAGKTTTMRMMTGL